MGIYTDSLKPRIASLLQGCKIKAADGTVLFTPDGMANYHALWTRDFAYMAEYAGDLMEPAEMSACIDYLIAGARPSDGWIPDRVYGDGQAVYTAGGESFPGLPNLDNGPFLIFAAEAYLSTRSSQEGRVWFDARRDALLRGIRCLPVNGTGLIVNDSEKPHSPYGFTDCIRKTGVLFMESLLLYRALKMLIPRLGSDAAPYAAWAEQLEKGLLSEFNAPAGLFYSATEEGRKPDVWASCCAVAYGLPMPEERKKQIADTLVRYGEGILYKGMVRHLLPGDYWTSFLEKVTPGEYQNGAYWSTATGWFYQAIRAYYPEQARKVIDDIMDLFQKEGFFECINRGGYRKLDTYVCSGTNVYGVCKAYGL